MSVRVHVCVYIWIFAGESVCVYACICVYVVRVTRCKCSPVTCPFGCILFDTRLYIIESIYKYLRIDFCGEISSSTMAISV